jgi:AcrR family transcriptional regulator
MTMKPVATPVRARKRERVPRDAEASRARLLAAAKIRFSQHGYDSVSVRDIARDADVDPALVIRYFGSKEGLFRIIAADAFDIADVVPQEGATLADHAVKALMRKIDGEAWRTGYDPLRFLLASIGSPVGGPIVSDCLYRDFIQPITKTLGGVGAKERATVLASQIIGFALVHAALASRGDLTLRRPLLKRLLTEAIQANAVPASDVA